MDTILDEEYITVADAAILLKVSPSTLWRWIDQGTLPAYRIGHRRVRVKKRELGRLITPARQRQQERQYVVGEEILRLGPLSKEEQERMLAAVESAERLQADQLERRSGKLYPSSVVIIYELREERSRQLE